MKILISLLLFSSCNVLKNIIGDSGKPDDEFYSNRNSGLHLQIDYPFLTRSVHIVDETYVREVFIDYNGEALECSSDGGSTFSSCNFPFVWEVTNYTQEHVVRAWSGEDFIEERFTPSDIFPGHDFLSCDYEVNSSESIMAFNTRAFVTGDVVCIGPGVVISNSGADGSVYNDADDITYITRSGDFAQITSGETGIIFADAGFRMNVIGLSINGTGTAQTGVDLSSDQSQFEDVNIDIPGNSSQGFNLALSGGSVYISNSSISVLDIGASEGIYANNSNVYLDNVNIDAGYNAIYLWKNDTGSYELAVKNSQLFGYKSDAPGPVVGVIETYSNENTNSYQVNLADSIVTSGGGPAIYIKGMGGVVDLNLVRTELSRNSDSNVDTAAIRVDTTGEVNTISVDPDSYICNYENIAGNMFDEILDDQSSLVSFDPTVMNAHTSNTDIGLCF